MLIKFPTIVYKCPGAHSLPEGKSYDYRPAKNKSEFEQLIKDGWSHSMPEAVLAFDGEKSAEKFEFEEVEKPKAVEKTKAVESVISESEEHQEEIEDNSPPTREELEQEAKRLEIKFTKKTTDSKLLELITEKLGE